MTKKMELDTRTNEQIKTDALKAYDVIISAIWSGGCKNPTYALCEPTIINLVGMDGLFDMVDCGLIHNVGLNSNHITTYCIR